MYDTKDALKAKHWVVVGCGESVLNVFTATVIWSGEMIMIMIKMVMCLFSHEFFLNCFNPLETSSNIFFSLKCLCQLYDYILCVHRLM